MPSKSATGDKTATAATVAAADAIDLDAILVEIGETGRYRWATWTLWSVIVVFSSLPYMSYIFTTGQQNYRCAVPQCEPIGADRIAAAGQYTADWVQHAIPHSRAGRMARCEQYQWVGGGETGGPGGGDDFRCDAAAFNQSHVVRCTEFVYESDEVTIGKEFNISCAENEWKLAMIGTMNYMAGLLLMPVCAVMSDRYGRRPILIATLLLTGCSGMTQSMSISYTMYAAMQFATAVVSCGTFMTVFVLASESSGPGQRVFVGTLISAAYSIGQGSAGLLASQFQQFRTYLRVLFAPNFVLIMLIWLVPESPRWLLTRNRVREAGRILKRAARFNGVALSEETRVLLAGECVSATADEEKQSTTKESPAEDTAAPNAFVMALRSRPLIMRLLYCLFTWFTNSFIYYGMNIHAVALAGSKYSNFILVNIVEVPAIFSSYFLMERFGRQHTLSVFLAINGVACLITEFVVPEGSIGRIVLYILGKCGVTISFTVLYVYTSELFPTAMRQTFMNTCSTVGAMGSMIAPLTPLLATFWAGMPMLLFGATALTSSALVLLLPETLNEPMPDTVEDAVRIGQRWQKIRDVEESGGRKDWWRSIARWGGE